MDVMIFYVNEQKSDDAFNLVSKLAKYNNGLPIPVLDPFSLLPYVENKSALKVHGNQVIHDLSHGFPYVQGQEVFESLAKILNEGLGGNENQMIVILSDIIKDKNIIKILEDIFKLKNSMRVQIVDDNTVSVFAHTQLIIDYSHDNVASTMPSNMQSIVGSDSTHVLLHRFFENDKLFMKALEKSKNLSQELAANNKPKTSDKALLMSGIVAIPASFALAFLISPIFFALSVVGAGLAAIPLSKKMNSFGGIPVAPAPVRQQIAAAEARTPSSAEGLREQLNSRHDKIINMFHSYELDLFMSLAYPSMVDPGVPQTRDFHKALLKANTIRESLAPNEVVEISSLYYDAVLDLEIAFKTAEEHAKKKGQFVWDAEERKNVKRAEDLLRIATNDGATTSERESAFKQAVKAVEGIATLPEDGQTKIRQAIGLIEA